MIISELIAKLQELPPALLVTIASNEGLDPDPVVNTERAIVPVLKEGWYSSTGHYSADAYDRIDAVVLYAW